MNRLSEKMELKWHKGLVKTDVFRLLASCLSLLSSPEDWREEHVEQKTVVKEGNKGAFS